MEKAKEAKSQNDKQDSVAEKEPITTEDLQNLNNVFRLAQKMVAEDENQYGHLIMFKQQLFKKLQP